MEFVNTVNEWLASHKELVTILAIPILTALVTWWTTRSNEKRAARERLSERELQRQLRLSEYRQAWIEGLRNDIAAYTALHWNAEIQAMPNARREAVEVNAKILMRMNPDDPDYENLRQAMLNPIASEAENRTALYATGQRILKREWERLKADLAKIDELR
ncbi:hypothetical protein [Maritimibacter sp. DP1N21-5]|uniref:hypothetical protein n=1 Tax=Maritimibacter sp. DP1N21-5 TaxID=2836867 RepID=UPI001C46E1A3|nr:hypothetical protein [Maritimibacter sp. DP1N21-5]MBV7409062.1 hypothetical protein [Maritimibacter sp. DP1N21-5]